MHPASSLGCCARTAVLKLGCQQRLCRRDELLEIVFKKQPKWNLRAKGGIIILLTVHQREGYTLCEILDVLNSIA